MVANKARTILIGAVLIAGTAIISSGCPQPIGPPIDAPVAAIGAQPASGVAPLQVQFADQSDPGTSAIATWTWDFGDGTTSAVPNPSHVYAAAGGYSVLLTVTTADGTDTASAGIVVAEGVWDLPHPVAAPAEYVNLGVFPYHRPDSALYGP
ncbi:MAG: PKD domain-containing protein, partial [Candidatus Hydrogenedentes bacterium]|nr:PKD domain-containing protein [Candidatus Hydrogenedentota bacterium]